MLEMSFGLLYFLKQPKNRECEERYVYLRITVNGQSRELSTKRVWFCSRWSQSAGKATGTKEDSKNLNAYLDALSAQVYQAKVRLMESGKPFTADDLKNLLLGKNEEKRMLLPIFSEHNLQMEALVGKEFVPATLSRYRTTYNYIKGFIQWKYGMEDIDIQELDYDFVSGFSFWLKTVKNCEHNTVMKYITNLKKIILICIHRGWLKGDPFMHFKTTRKEVVKVALTQEELDRIRNKANMIERLEFVRDIFVFSCYTGLAYVDVSKLRRSQIVTGIDGEQWIMTTRQKTGSPTRLPLLPVALQIVDKYKDHPKCSEDGFVLPMLSNQKMNAYLKEIADVCGVKKNLTCHIARHTFATTVTLSNGVPIETVSKMLGHKSIKQTQHYAKILDTKISSDMLTLRTKLSV